ncbi:hypothetical protein PVAP13_1KG180000 [Panicum virgatum]|uniref:CCHC-type domain-containing protein n=1 Tax=Panicum virgatum TaxID=38727 RepID=A0A8T0XJH3_PANVG|nr:hypothetical protein PVAP13_1KG180000 [Panicum virgatum]
MIEETAGSVLVARSPTSPPPPTPGTAATHRTAPHLTETPPALSSSLSPVPTGRSKFQRWQNASPPSGSPECSSPTPFKDALLRRAPPATSWMAPCDAARRVPPPVVTPSSRAEVTRIVLRPPDRRALPVRRTDSDGWQEAMSRRARRARLRQARLPHRRVPGDLRGRCFNCFSEDHRAVACRSKPRCFVCRGLGHISYRCQRRRTDAGSTGQRRVWVPMDAAPAAGALGSVSTCSPPLPVATATRTCVEAAGVERRRRRCRGRRAASPGGPPSPSVPGGDVEGDGGRCDVYSGLASSDDGSSAAVSRPRRIIDRSASIVQREEDLSKALVVSVFGDCLDGSASAISATIAARFELQNEAAATRVFNGGRPIVTNSHRLHVRRWSRFINAKAASLPVAVEVELRGIPAHAWELATAEALLNDFCWIGDLHPETAERRDVFHLAGWCSSLESVPSEVDLEIIEAPVAGDGGIPAKRSLLYPVEVSLVRHDQPDPTVHPTPPPPPPADRRRRQRWRHRYAQADAAALGSAGGGPEERVLVQQRLGSVRLSRGSVDGGRGTRGRGETEAVPSATGAYSLEELGGAAECLAARVVASPDAPVEIQHEELALQPEELIAENLLGAALDVGEVVTDVGDPLTLTVSAGEGVEGSMAPLISTGDASAPPALHSSPTFSEDPSLEALEALVFVETAVSRATAPHGGVDGGLRVYYRRKQRSRQPSPPPTEVAQPQLAVAPLGCSSGAGEAQSPATLRRMEFIDNLTKKTDSIVALPPVINKRQNRAPPPTSAPRRSRRNAGLSAEFGGIPDIGARKTVIRSLDIAMEQVHIDQRVLNDYAKLFSNLLSMSHVQALAALFGWNVPEGLRNMSNISTAFQC